MRCLGVLLIAACGSASTPGAPATGSGPAPTDPTVTAVRPAEPAAANGDVSLTTLDGVVLAASYVPGPTGSDRAVVFLHQLSSTRAEWALLIEALHGKYHLLAIDMRGHGGSTHGEHGAIDWHSFKQAEWEAVTGDLAAASQFLSAKGVPLGGIVMVGSSIGSTAVIRFAGEHPDLGGIVALSPGLAYRGVETVPSARKYGRPKLVIYSADAEDAARGLEQAWKQADRLPQPQPVTMHLVPGKAHGVKMIGDDPELVDAVVAFVDKTLAR